MSKEVAKLPKNQSPLVCDGKVCVHVQTRELYMNVLLNEQVHKNSWVDNEPFAIDCIMYRVKIAIPDLPVQTLLRCHFCS